MVMRRARAKTRRGQAGGQAALVGEPFQRIADAGAVDRAGADAADRGGDVEHGERTHIGVQHPRDADQHAADHHDDLGAVAVDEPAFDRHQPGLGEHEDGEGDLDGGAVPAVLLPDRPDEQRPSVLQVGDHHHTDNADQQLQPAAGRRLCGRSLVRRHGDSSQLGRFFRRLFLPLFLPQSDCNSQPGMQPGTPPAAIGPGQTRGLASAVSAGTPAPRNCWAAWPETLPCRSPAPVPKSGKTKGPGEAPLDSVMQTPFKPIEFLSRDVAVEKRDDGTILLQSNHALKPYERHVPAFLAKWAAQAPDRVWLAQRRGPDRDWLKVTYGEAKRQVDARHAGAARPRLRSRQAGHDPVVELDRVRAAHHGRDAGARTARAGVAGLFGDEPGPRQAPLRLRPHQARPGVRAERRDLCPRAGCARS